MFFNIFLCLKLQQIAQPIEDLYTLQNIPVIIDKIAEEVPLY